MSTSPLRAPEPQRPRLRVLSESDEAPEACSISAASIHQPPAVAVDAARLAPLGWRGYLAIARPDHWFKNVFMLPGAMLALIMSPAGPFYWSVLPLLAVALASLCMAASANYVINEYLDAEFDRHHPTKKDRPCVSGAVGGGYVLLEYLLLASTSLASALLLGIQYLLVTAVFLLMGILYNVRPLRTKDRQYLDVLSESINNPLRFLLGWSVVLANQLPPSSILFAYWMGGAFLMGTKRYAEYRSIGDPRVAARYRASFRYYTEQSLMLSLFFYALVASFFLGIFLIKYRIEFLLTAPLFALLFTWYLSIGMQADSPAQTPEKLFRQWRFTAFSAALALLVCLLFYVDIPWLRLFLEPRAFGGG